VIVVEHCQKRIRVGRGKRFNKSAFVQFRRREIADMFWQASTRRVQCGAELSRKVQEERTRRTGNFVLSGCQDAKDDMAANVAGAAWDEDSLLWHD
jgi:hypothetical protein